MIYCLLISTLNHFMLILLLGSCHQMFWFDPFGPAGQYIGFWVLQNSDLWENIKFLLYGIGCFCTSLPKMWTPPLKAHVHRCHFDFLASCTIFCWKRETKLQYNYYENLLAYLPKKDLVFIEMSKKHLFILFLFCWKFLHLDWGSQTHYQISFAHCLSCFR